MEAIMDSDEFRPPTIYHDYRDPVIYSDGWDGLTLAAIALFVLWLFADWINAIAHAIDWVIKH
jgi:hypothetical protein